MHASLLPTSLRVPPQPHHVVERTRLTDAIERAVPIHKLVLLSAPAGYGKTTLLAEWTRSSRLPVVWLSADEADNDRDYFFRRLLAAWEQIDPSVRASPLGLLLGSMLPEERAIVSAFVSLVGQTQGHLVFVIDDAHLLTDARIRDALSFLIDHLPPTVHLVLASRGEPGLPLARYRAQRQVLEFGIEELRFSLDESAELMAQLVERDLTVDEIIPFHTQLEGWVAGLQLAALTLQRGVTRTGTPFAGGRHRFIADYLMEEVLAHLSDETRRFLLQTSLLDRLCAPLCSALTGQPGSQEMLDTLERDGLFLIPLDDQRIWFRYHLLFADFLRAELRQHHVDEIVQLHQRAARWYRDHGLPEAALPHAVAGNDLDLTAEVAERLFEIKLLGGEFEWLNHWLASIPKAWQTAYPMFGLFRAGTLLFTGAIDAGIRCVDDVEQNLPLATKGDMCWHRARVTAIRCTIACFMNDLPLAEQYADRALMNLPADDHMIRSAIHHALGDTYRRNRRWDKAKSHYFRALELTNEPAFHIRSVHVLGALADLALSQGQLRQSAVYWKRALTSIHERANWGTLPLPLIGWVFMRYGEILLEWNDLTGASWYLSQGLERAELSGDVRALVTGYLLMARLKLAEGAVETAVVYLDRARPFMQDVQFPELASRFDECQVAVWLALGERTRAVTWASALLEGADLARSPDGDPARLAAARALLTRGDSSTRDQASELLGSLLDIDEKMGQTRTTIEALALLAIAREKSGDLAGALIAVERALRLAEPEGYVRIFVNLDLPMARLLQEAQSRHVMPGYIAMLLRSFGWPEGQARGLPEPLSRREQEVLRLISAGLTNREVADTLVISAETVKKHTSSIYAKLGVRSRTEAAARARALDLLQ